MKTALYRLVTKGSQVWKSSEPLVRKMQTVPVAKTILGSSPLWMTVANCEGSVQLDNHEKESLTREGCIKQACLLNVNSASTLLTTTSSALLDICNEYKASLMRILSLLEELQNSHGENLSLWDEIVEARAVVNRAKAAVTEMNGYMTSVEKVVNSTTETAFLVGAEYMCTTLCERLYSAQKEISTQINELKKLEEEYMKVQREIVLNREKEKKDAVKGKSSGEFEFGHSTKFPKGRQSRIRTGLVSR